MGLSLHSLNILYLGPISGTCLDRANAIKRLGHQLTQIDLRKLLPKTIWVDRVTWKIGGDLFAPWILNKLPQQLSGQHYDICYIDGGEWVTPKVIGMLRKYAKVVINYNIDDPYGSRDGARSKAYRKSVPYYDLIVVVREENLDEAKHLGAKNVMHVYRAADEVSHAPRVLTEQDHRKWDSEVLFLGTWMPERGPFLLSLIQQGVPLTIRGGRWQKAPEWPLLEPYWKGGSIEGDDYAKAIQCAKVNIGLLSKGNRDLHTTRSAEIPAIGSLFCAERTRDHLAMYQEGIEALFWQDATECAEMCKFALENETRRVAISDAGSKRLKINGHYNEPTSKKIIEKAMSLISPPKYLQNSSVEMSDSKSLKSSTHSELGGT